MTQSDGDFNLAMQYLEDAFSRTNSNDPDYVDQIHHFGVLYHDRFRSTGATADMVGAVTKLQQAIGHTPGSHPN